MNEETIQTEEPSVPETEASLPPETAAPEASDQVVIYEDLSGAATEETITLVEIQSVGLEIVHADLFGSFLICGTLVGLALFRGRHGSH